MPDELVQSAPAQGTSQTVAEEQDSHMSRDPGEAPGAMTPNEVRRLQVLSAAAPGIALELGNVMTVVLGSLEQLHRQPLDEAGREQLQRAESGSRQVTRLIRQTLALARSESRHEQLVDLNEAVRGLDKMLAHTAGENVEVTFDLARGPLLAKLEITRLELALLGIVRDARERLGNAGQIVVRTSGHPAEQLAGQPTVEVSVTSRWSDLSAVAIQCHRGLRPLMAEGPASSCNGTTRMETAVEGGVMVRLVFPKASDRQ